MAPSNPRILALFDVDGTLTIPRGVITPEMMTFLKALGEKITVGIVGGSDLPKQEEQLGDGIVNLFPYNFSQNGLVAYKDGNILEVQTISKFLGEDNVKRIVNWTMKYLADVDIPVKRGTFIEFRSGMFNISPIGRNCSREERNDYEKFDLEHKIRENMVVSFLARVDSRRRCFGWHGTILAGFLVDAYAYRRRFLTWFTIRQAAMKKEFADLDLTFSIGGQISFDVFPTGWDKTYCLNFVKAEDFDEIHFFGDKTFEGKCGAEAFFSNVPNLVFVVFPLSTLTIRPLHNRWERL